MSTNSQKPESQGPAPSMVCYVLALIFAVCGIVATLLGVSLAFFPGIVSAVVLGGIGVFAQLHDN